MWLLICVPRDGYEPSCLGTFPTDDDAREAFEKCILDVDPGCGLLFHVVQAPTESGLATNYRDILRWAARYSGNDPIIVPPTGGPVPRA